MTPANSLESWIKRLSDLEEGLNSAIKALKRLEKAANWSPQQRQQIQDKIQELENVLIPF